MSKVVRKRMPRKAAVLSPVQKKQVKRLIGNRQEHKYFQSSSNGSVDNTGSVTNITTIAQGDTSITRDGDQIYLSEVDVRFSWICSDGTNTVRTIMFQWKPDNAQDAPVVADILRLSSAYGTISSYNLSAERAKYKILADRSYALTLAGDASRVARMRVFGKKLTKHIFYNTAGATTHDNGIYLLFISDSSAISHPSVNWESTIRFTDS